MDAELSFQATPVMIGADEVDGWIVFWSGRAVAVLTRLCGAHYQEADGSWYLEAGFGPCADKRPDPFASLSDAEAWIGRAVS